jgi:hypothetical protein
MVKAKVRRAHYHASEEGAAPQRDYADLFNVVSAQGELWRYARARPTISSTTAPFASA